MARVTYVKKAQPRYRTVAVIDPETGQQKLTPVMGRNGQQKKNKHGRLTFLRLTVADKSQPLPNRKCDNCGKEIETGQPYKWIKPKSGPYGGSMKVRCGTCPTWQVWEYSYSMSAQLARISYEAGESFDQGVETESDVTSILETAAEEIRGIAEEKRQSASNMEEGFGHSTEKSDELNEIADNLDSWADDVEQADVPDAPEDDEYPDHEFEQNEDDEADDTCQVEGCEKDESEHETTMEEALETWRDEAREALGIVDECPI